MPYYNRENVVEYANRYALNPNPAFYNFENLGGDCTNFASQCIFAGAQVMNFTPVFGWYYIDANNRTPSWTGVEELYNFLVNNTSSGPRGEVVELYELQIGDIIQLKFREGPRFDHTPVVTSVGDLTPETILVAAHTNNSKNRPLSTYNYIDIRPIHILDFIAL